MHPIRSKEHAGSAKQDKYPGQFALPKKVKEKKEEEKACR